jgi:4-amino-4-deoxy-L-arabinose transferase-like glycosyltransferase
MFEHLSMIQTIITRMGTNSFLIRGWAVTILAATFALAAKDANEYFVLIGYFVVPMFWLLDGYYLHQERSFPSLYDAVRKTSSQVEPFSMDTRTFRVSRDNWFYSTFSKIMIVFHGSLLLVVYLATYILSNSK